MVNLCQPHSEACQHHHVPQAHANASSLQECLHHAAIAQLFLRGLPPCWWCICAEVVGYRVPLRNNSTPFLTEDHKDALAGALGVGPVRECPWCYHTGTPASFVQYSYVDKLPVWRKVKAETSVDSEVVEKQSVATGKKPILDEGVLASVACSIFMKILWSARLARPDLLPAVNHLATRVTK